MRKNCYGVSKCHQTILPATIPFLFSIWKVRKVNRVISVFEREYCTFLQPSHSSDKFDVSGLFDTKWPGSNSPGTVSCHRGIHLRKSPTIVSRHVRCKNESERGTCTRVHAPRSLPLFRRTQERFCSSPSHTRLSSQMEMFRPDGGTFNYLLMTVGEHHPLGRKLKFLAGGPPSPGIRAFLFCFDCSHEAPLQR